MAAESCEWLTAAEASARYGIPYPSLRKLVADGVFTRGQFGTATRRPPIFLRVVELDAWKSGGVAAARRLKDAWAVASVASFAAPAPVHDLGGEA